MEATLPLPHLVARRPRPWIRRPGWDLACLLSAVWLVPLVLVLSAGPGDPADGPLDTLFFALTTLFWLGHRVGSMWLAYCTTAYRPFLRAARFRFAVVPIGIATLGASRVRGESPSRFRRATVRHAVRRERDDFVAPRAEW